MDLDDSPPPYSASGNDPNGFFDHLQERMSAPSAPNDITTVSTASSDLETERLRNFLEFALSMDYQRNPHAVLTAADRIHFSELWSHLQDLRNACDNTRATPAERSVLAPYFWRFLHEPCKELRIPTERALITIERFFKYLSFLGRYKGCVFGTIHNEGIEKLAAKIYLDREVLIPRIIPSWEQRQLMLLSTERVESRYFSQILGIDGSTMASSNQARWEQIHSVNYTANERGQAYEAQRQYAMGSNTDRSRWALSLLHWAERARLSTAAILSLSRDIEAGREKKDKLGSWRGQDDEVPPGTDSWSHLWQLPYTWKWWRSMHLPDFFEHRPGKDYAEV